jgi:formylglycine-generating enzyme required for sulfatase activity
MKIALAAALSILLGASAFAADWPDISAPPAASGGGERDAAVIVGAEHYAFVEGVPGARRNAADWQAYLTGTLKVPAERVALLLDDDATNDEIRQAAAEKAAQVEPGGTLWFVFIGHGAPSKDGKDGLLVGVDAQQKAESVYKRSLSRDDLLAVLAGGKQAKTVVLLDACFSGRSPSGRELVANLQPLLTMRGGAKGADARTILMTAARSDQFAGPLPKASETRPAFSYLALGALRGWAADASGKVTAAAVVGYAKKALSLAHDRAQTPELSAGAADAVLGRGSESAPDLARLDRESAGFSVTALAPVRAAHAPAPLAESRLNLDRVDVDALEAYDRTAKFEKTDAPPADKAAAWRKLAQDAPAFARTAGDRAEEWGRFAAAKAATDDARKQRLAARDADWKKLGRLLTLGVVSDADKRDWADRFLKAYQKDPGLEPAMAKGLAPHVPAGRTRAQLETLGRKPSVEAPPSEGMADLVLAHLEKIDKYRELAAAGDKSVDEKLASLRADAAATKVAHTPDGRVLQYSVGGQTVTDAGIAVADLDKSRAYRETIAKAIADNIMTAPAALEAEKALAAGRSGIDWVKLPAGSFEMGSTNHRDSSPPHPVSIRSFEMGRAPVTNKQYQACVTAGACTPAQSMGTAFAGDDQPVVGVDWTQASAFAKWARGRLPTEAEWEYAARGAGRDQYYPWGNQEPTCERAVISGCGKATAPVCSTPSGNTAQGLCDMAGNVWQWVADAYHDSYSEAPTDGAAWEGEDTPRVVRGSAWTYVVGPFNVRDRLHRLPGERDDAVGFRVAR